MDKEYFIVGIKVGGCKGSDDLEKCPHSAIRTDSVGEFTKGLCTISGKSKGVYSTSEEYFRDLPMLKETFEENKAGITPTCPLWAYREKGGA